MIGRAWQLGICVITLLVIFGAVALSSAPAATSSWDWENSGQIGDFGATLAGGGPTEPHEYVLANTGEAPITIERFIFGVQSTSEPHRWSISHNDCKIGVTIDPGQTCSVDVVFEPLTTGWKLGRLRVEAVGGEPPEARVEYEGHAVGPWVEPEPRRLEFGSVQVGSGPSPIQTITVTNGEPLSLHIYGTAMTDIYDRPEPSSRFRVVGGTCQEGVVITLGSCTVEVVVEPAEVGPLESKLWISDSAEGEQSVLLRGSGVAPPVEPTRGPTTVPKSEEPELPTTSSSEGGNPVAGGTVAEASPTKGKVTPIVCPKNKRKAFRRGLQVCVNRHHPHRSHRG